jgi:hypothetical protein
MTNILALDLASVTGWACGEPGSEPEHGSHRSDRCRLSIAPEPARGSPMRRPGPAGLRWPPGWTRTTGLAKPRGCRRDVVTLSSNKERVSTGNLSIGFLSLARSNKEESLVERSLSIRGSVHCVGHRRYHTSPDRRALWGASACLSYSSRPS